MKATIISICIALVLVGGALVLTKKTPTEKVVVDANNVSIVDGKQIVEIKAKGGYIPRVSTAQAGIPTIIRFDTKGTFDCSSFVRIPSMNISKALPQSGKTDIDIGVQPAGTFQGMCGMGMYPFEIIFKS